MHKLLQQNSGLAEEVRNAQENLRLSNTQHSKAFAELQEHKNRLDQLNSDNDTIRRKMGNLVQENQQLADEVNHAQ